MEDVTNSPKDWTDFWENSKDIRKLPCNDLRYVQSEQTKEEIETQKYLIKNFQVEIYISENTELIHFHFYDFKFNSQFY